jgi:choline monooxygenase
MPEFEGVENFPGEKDSLPKIPFGFWEKLIFASVKPTVKLEEVIGEMKKRLFFLPLSEFKHEPVRSRDYLVKAHWSLYCENYLEGFHIPYIHPGLSNAIDYNTYTTELYKYSNLQLALAKGGEEHFSLPSNHPDFGKKVAAYYYWLFPNMMFNFYPWGLSINVVKPLAPDLTKVSFITYIYDATKLERGAGGILDKVEREDEAIVELVQKGIKSRMYAGGRYSPKRETGTHHLHQLICEFMNK